MAGRLGLGLRLPTAKELDAHSLKGGLVVVQTRGAAVKAGVQEGDVLVAVNGQPVTNVDQVRAIVQDSPKSVALLISRGGDQIFVPVRPD